MHAEWMKSAIETTRISEAAAYQRKPANIFGFYGGSEEIRRSRLAEISRPTVLVPETFLYSYRNIYLSDLTLAYTEAGDLLPISEIDHVGKPPLTQLVGYHDGRPVPRLESAMMIFKAGAPNYGHLIAEMLPKLIYLQQTGRTDRPLYIPSLTGPLRSIVNYVLETHFKGVFEVFYSTTPLVLVEDLTFVGPVTKHNVQKSEVVRLFGKTLSERWRHPSRRIFTSRRKAKARPMNNAAQVEALFGRAGFEIVYPETMTFVEQIKLFASAKHIAGPLGSALTSMMFAAPECRVTMLDGGICDFFFHDLASLGGQTFDWIFTAEQRAATVEALTAPMHVQIPTVEAAIDAIL